MSSEITRRKSPEETELEAKQAELDALLNQLAQKELDLETLHAEINTFFLAYNAALLPKISEAQELRARIAHAMYILDPREDTKNKSQEARESADRVAQLRDPSGATSACDSSLQLPLRVQMSRTPHGDVPSGSSRLRYSIGVPLPW